MTIKIVAGIHAASAAEAFNARPAVMFMLTPVEGGAGGFVVGAF